MDQEKATLLESIDHVAQVRKVLIVDDDVDFAETVADILEHTGYDIRLAHSISEATETAQRFTAQVALLDIRLGSTESGIQLISALKEIQPKIMCIMMTGFAALDTAIQALKDGAYDYLRKPVSPDDLFATLNRCFETVELIQAKETSDRKLQQRNQDLDSLNNRMRGIVNAARRFTACRELEELSPMIVEEFIDLMQARGGSLFLVHQNTLERLYSTGSDHVPKRIDFPLPQRSVFHRVYSSAKPLLIEDIAGDEECIGSGWQGYEDGSLLVFPILNHQDEVRGLVSLHSKKDAPFTSQDRELGIVLCSLSAEVLFSLQAARALSEEERRFRELADLLPAVVFEIDPESKFTFINRRAAELTGYSEDEFKSGFEAAQLVHEGQRERLLDMFKAVMRGESKGNDDFTLISKDGRKIQVLVNCATIYHNNRISGVRGFLFDISERIEAERRRAQLATAVDQAAEVMLIMDRRGAITYINPVYHFLTGIKQTEAIGAHLQDVLANVHNEDFFESVWDTLRGGKIWAGRLNTKKKDGTDYESEATISPLRNDQGEIINFVAVLRDISHETSLEKRLRQAEKLEAIGTLAGGIAHDFNNILSPIIGFTEIVREEIRDNEDAYRNLEKVLNACHMARELVRRILTFSRQAESERKPVKVAKEVQEALKLLRPSIPSTVDIRADINRHDASVYADPTELHQVIMNLCTNAYQAMQGGGIMSLRLFNCMPSPDIIVQHPRLQMNHEHVVLEVADTGVGMPKSTLDRIFDPFFSTKEMGKGTGLGLATVHGIVMEMGGDIDVQSEPGKGTRISVYMPRYDMDDHSIERVEDHTPSGGMERILFVDDEVMILQLGEKMLTRLGYSVEICTGSSNALKRFREGPNDFDLVITDQTMPGITGQELAGKIKQIRSDIPIILITGFSSVLDLEQLNHLGISQIVHKPFTRNDIGSAIKSVLQTVRG